MGYCDYFVVVQDIIKYCSDNGILTGPGRGCLTYDTPVYVNGSIKRLGDIRSGDKVITHDGSSQVVLNTQKYEIDEDLLRFTTECGDSHGITMTSDHKVYSKKFKLNSSGIYTSITDLNWFRASELSIGDYIFTPWINTSCVSNILIDLSDYSVDDRYKTNGDVCEYIYTNPLTKISRTLWSYERYIQYDTELAYMLGVFTGDGWLLSRKSHMFGLCFNSETNITSLERIKTYLNNKNICFAEYKHKSKKLVQLEIKWPHMAQFIRSIFNKYKYKSNTKHIPDFIKSNFSKVNITSYLKGLLDADGHAESNRFKYSTTSHDLAYDVKYLFNLIKIPASILILARKPDTRGYNNQLVNYGLSIPVVYQESQFVLTPKTRTKILNDGYLSRITNVSTVKAIKTVYDIEVENNHNYLTSSGIVHNSAAGCLISYCLGITWIDPIKYDLLFSRFLSSSRAKLPLIEFEGYPLSEYNYEST